MNNQHDLGRFLLELDDHDPLVRQEAAIGLGDFCRIDHPAIDVLIERLQSPEQTPHDRACAAWALGRIRAKASEVIPILLSLIEEMKEQAEADELRSYAVEAIENLTGEMDVLLTVTRYCLVDMNWQCRMKGLFLVERLLKRQPGLRDCFVPMVEQLTTDKVEEVREKARRMLDEFEGSE